MQLNNTPIEQITFNKYKFFIKRDDLLDKDFTGNKARKFLYFLENEFEDIKKIVSYGSAQSNAMYSLSVLAKLKQWQFDFYVDHIASFLKENPQGNYKGALENGMNIIEDSSFKERSFIISKDTLFIPEGGRAQSSEYGIKKLAQELKDAFVGKNVKLFLPSGTGTTALFLQKNLPDFEVLTCACVGDENYLKKQFYALEKDEKCHPTILNTPKKYHFGKLYKELYEIWIELYKETKIEFDLLYDPIGWKTLIEYLEQNDIQEEIAYIHQGGLKGNETMIDRYKRKYDK